VAPGLPGFTIVGLADTALQEARESGGAIRNSGYEYRRADHGQPGSADLRKGGAVARSGIALGIMVGSEQVTAAGRWAVLGELSLGGELRPVPGLLPMVAALARTPHSKSDRAGNRRGGSALAEGVEVVPRHAGEAAPPARQSPRQGRAVPPGFTLLGRALRVRRGVTRDGIGAAGGRPVPAAELI